LLSAAASLDAARDAVITGRPADLLTQLLTAQHALNGYAASEHFPAARALAVKVGQLLPQAHQPPQMLRYQLADWASQICGWVGSERWGAGVP
jgi:transposase